MPFNVNDIRAQLTGGGARPNLFEVVMPFPSVANAGSAGTKMTFTCKGAQMPGSDLGMVEMNYFGRTIKLAGNRTFPEWTTTIINDEDFSVYNAIQTWMNSINSHSGNIREAGSNPINYHSTADVIHYGKAGEEIKRVTIVNMWPSTLAPIDLAWESNDALEEFTCTWQYDFWQTPGITS
jgi:hypothetical protein